MFYKITLKFAMILTAMSATAEQERIDFADPTSSFSAAEITAGTDGVGLGLTLAGSLTPDWAFLSKLEARNNAELYRARLAAVSSNFGSGLMLDYIKHEDFHKDIEDSKSDTLVINAMQVLPLNEGKTLIVPIVGVGYTDNDLARKKTNIWMVQAMLIHNWTDQIWTNFIPMWTTGFSDMEMKYGIPDQEVKSFDIEFLAGYRFKGNQNVRLHVANNEDDTTEVWGAYTYAF
ncbi:MAG: hypothetical protein JKY50_02635 [Oleispira sp.]|nr:hypothetical protein [Oleispira sp.]MBL4880006.1 hypothetical protein [Oleispira sp.]